MGQCLPQRTETALLPRLLHRTRGAWEHLGRPVTLPETPAEWESLLSNRGPVDGPFDWSLTLGPMRTKRNGRLTKLGHVIEAWRVHAYSDAREALARLAHEFLERAHSEFHFDLQGDLPRGFESGRMLSFADLLEDSPLTELWRLDWASSYEQWPAQAEVADRALSVAVPVRDRRVLLTTPLYDRAEVASSCVHLLRAQGAEWVGLLALATDVYRE